jgi:hypothetical protein
MLRWRARSSLSQRVWIHGGQGRGEPRAKVPSHASGFRTGLAVTASTGQVGDMGVGAEEAAFLAAAVRREVAHMWVL